MRSLEVVLVLGCMLVLISVLASKASGRSSVSALLLFLGIGMLAGSEGIGGIYFDNAELARSVGVVALALILFSGGLDTHVASIRPVLARGIVLSTVGTLVAAGLVGIFATARRRPAPAQCAAPRCRRVIDRCSRRFRRPARPQGASPFTGAQPS